MVSFFYLSEILGREIVDINGEKIGRIRELVISPIGEKFPEVSHIVINGRKFPWSFVNRVDKKITLSVKGTLLRLEQVSRKDILLSKSLLDQQIVDTDGLKVVRVNDIVLSEVGGKLCVVSIDVGTRGLLRRLGVEKLANLFSIKERLLPWGYAEPLQPTLRQIKIKIPKRKFEDLHPADIASVVTELSTYEREILMNGLDREKFADTIAKMDASSKVSFFERLDDERAVELLKELPPDESADILSIVAPEKAKIILSLMPEDLSARISELLKYSNRSVGSIMTTDFFSFPPEITVREAISRMRARPDAKVFNIIYLVDKEGRPKGAVSIRRLVLSRKSSRLSEIVSRTRAVKVNLHANKSKAAKLMAKYDFVTIAVVDSRGKLRGVVTADDAISAILPPRVSGNLPHFLVERERI
ncbi:MAG: CBS domain-containing protein [archaeon]